MEDGQAHQSGQANGWAHIIREHRKGGTGWTKDTIISNTVYDRTHGMFTDTKEKISTGMIVLGKISHFLDVILGGTMQISRPADQQRHRLGEIVDDLASGSTGGHTGILRELLDTVHQIRRYFAGESGIK